MQEQEQQIAKLFTEFSSAAAQQDFARAHTLAISALAISDLVHDSDNVWRPVIYRAIGQAYRGRERDGTTRRREKKREKEGDKGVGKRVAVIEEIGGEEEGNCSEPKIVP